MRWAVSPPPGPPHPTPPIMVCGGFACSRNALCALNVVYVVSGAGGGRRGAGACKGEHPTPKDLGLGGGGCGPTTRPPGGFGVPPAFGVLVLGTLSPVWGVGGDYWVSPPPKG